MKVFLSWSGQRSGEVASLLSDWLCCVIQASRPWISSRDLDRGSLWFGEINDQLKDTTVGIICLTQENKNRPWILFEAGALAKGLSTARVCTFLVDLEPKDIEDPLAQFNHTFPTKESVFGLAKTLNNSLGVSGLDIRILEQVFNTYWPQFDEKFKSILKNSSSQPPSQPRPKEDMLGEILDITRQLNSRVRRIEMESRDPQMRMLDELGIEGVQEYQMAKAMANDGLPFQLILEKFEGKVPFEKLLLLKREREKFRRDAKN
jgi:hypothetical protein